MARTIDYERQFKIIGDVDRIAVSTEFKRERTYFSAEQAFKSAARSEARGLDVAFAKNGGLYVVWTGARV